MFTLSRALWTDESGFIISTELVLIATVGVIGMTAALACVRDSVVGELNDVAGAIGSLNQSYCYTGFSAASPQCCKSRTFGSCFTDHEEGGEITRTDVHSGSVIQQVPTPVIEERIIEEQVIEAPAIRQEQIIEEERVIESDSPVCPQQPVGPAAGTATLVAGASTCTSCTSAQLTGDPCGKNTPRPVHAAKTICGETLHYSETRGEVVRLIDEVDAIHRPKVTPRLPLW